MTKKNIIIGIIMVVLGIAIGYGSSYLISKNSHKEEQKEKEENNTEKGTKYFIDYYDGTIPGTTYKLEFEQEGKYTLEVYHASSALDVEPTTDNYKGELTKDQLNKIVKVLDKIVEDNNLTFEEEYAFYFKSNVTSENEIGLKPSQLKKINSIVFAVECIGKDKDDQKNYTEIGNNTLDYLIKELEEEEKEQKDGYRKIIFGDYYIVDPAEIEIKKGEKISFKYENNKIYLNNKELPINISNISQDAITVSVYAVDLDEDGTLEIIIKTMDDSISPISVTHYFYKYLDGEFKEVTNFHTIGPVSEFYVKENDIKISYEPAEAAPGFKLEEHYTMKY